MKVVEIRGKLAEMNGDVERRLPCRFCGQSTLIETLSQYGARCWSCYEAYCQQLQTSPHVGDKTGGPRAWAYELRNREQRGERLSIVQREMWRQAIGEDA